MRLLSVVSNPLSGGIYAYFKYSLYYDKTFTINLNINWLVLFR